MTHIFWIDVFGATFDNRKKKGAAGSQGVWSLWHCNKYLAKEEAISNRTVSPCLWHQNNVPVHTVLPSDWQFFLKNSMSTLSTDFLCPVKHRISEDVVIAFLAISTCVLILFVSLCHHCYTLYFATSRLKLQKKNIDNIYRPALGLQKPISVGSDRLNVHSWGRCELSWTIRALGRIYITF